MKNFTVTFREKQDQAHFWEEQIKPSGKMLVDEIALGFDSCFLKCPCKDVGEIRLKEKIPRPPLTTENEMEHTVGLANAVIIHSSLLPS